MLLKNEKKVSLKKTFVMDPAAKIWQIVFSVISFIEIVSLRSFAEDCRPSPLSRAWGPGLEPSLVLPVRYFFIQSVDSSGYDLNCTTVSPTFQLTVVPLSGHCGVYKEILDRKNGSSIVRYRIYDACRGLRIEVRLSDGRHIEGSPWVYENLVLHSDCDCPILVAEWKKIASCPTIVPQIENDLQEFISEIPVDVFQHFRDLSARFHPQSASFCHYVIKKNLLHRKCFGEHVGFAMFMDSILLFLLRRSALPDVNFMVNLGDYPLSSRKKERLSKIPLFSWCGSTESFDIVMPTYDITESSLTAMDRVTLDLLSVQASTTPVWKEKIEKAFWRGRDARRERLRLTDIARENPDLINASLTNFFFFRDEEEKYGPKVPHVDFFQFFQFKYQINVDGTVAAYRFPYLLAGDSVVLKQESNFYEHFYSDLKAWEHYIPVRRDLSDLVEKINWAKKHDEEAKRISDRGAEYSRNNLLPHNIFCYYTLLLEKWANFVVPVAEVPGDYELVRQGDNLPAACDCTQLESPKLKSRVEKNEL